MYRIRIHAVYVGSVRKDIWDVYSKAVGVNNVTEHVRYLVEKEILCKQINNAKDITEATSLLQNIYYNNIGEWVSDYMRRKSLPHICLCKNCQYLEEDGFCPIVSGYPIPLLKGCLLTIQKRAAVSDTTQ